MFTIVKEIKCSALTTVQIIYIPSKFGVEKFSDNILNYTDIDNKIYTGIATTSEKAAKLFAVKLAQNL